MKIIAHGIDIVPLHRVAERLNEPESRWVMLHFSNAERQQTDESQPPTEYYAGRWAGKEAVSKALGTGFADDVTVHTIEILRHSTGAPYVRLTGGALDTANALGISACLISISHDGGFAVASVIAVGD